MDSVDVLVMGRKTYEKVRSFGEWPYGSKPVVVLSSGSVNIPDDLNGTVESMYASPSELVDNLAARGIRHAYIDGGQTIQGFLREGLIQQITITTIPVLIGGGIPLFGPLNGDIKLRHIATLQFPNGFVQSKYEICD